MSDRGKPVGCTEESPRKVPLDIMTQRFSQGRDAVIHRRNLVRDNVHTASNTAVSVPVPEGRVIDFKLKPEIGNVLLCSLAWRLIKTQSRGASEAGVIHLAMSWFSFYTKFMARFAAAILF